MFIMNHYNLTDELTQQSLIRPDAIAIYTADTQTTFSELEKRVWQASTLLHNHGIRSGNVIVLTFSDELTLLITLLATARIGATSFTLAKDMPAIQRAQMIASINAQRVATDCTDFQEKHLSSVYLDRATLFAASSSVNLSIRDEIPIAPRAMAYGSGSTGNPKCIPSLHRNFRPRMKSIVEVYCMTPDDILASSVHLNFNYTQHLFLSALCSGTAIVLYDRAATDPVQLVNNFHITIFDATVSYIEQLLNHLPKDAKEVLPSLKCLLLTYSTVSDSLRRRIATALTKNLFVMYGSNESGALTRSMPPEIYTTSGTVGRPLSRVNLEIVDRNGNVLPRGEVGLIRVKRGGMISGYQDDDEATQRSFRDGWFYPGDLGKFTPDGELIHMGRADHMMIMNGINIYPAEIERLITTHPNVTDAAAMPLNSPIHQNIPVCAVVLQEGSAITEQELLDFTYQRLGGRGPKRVIVLQSIPRTEQGKLIRAQLAQEIADQLGIALKENA
jgi:acyl-coenzyme A synthetase/AMP-(fatty) acid ligase